MGICKGLHSPLPLTPAEGPSRCPRLGTRPSLQGPSLCRRPSSRASPLLCRQRCAPPTTLAHVADASGTLSFALHHCKDRAAGTTPPHPTPPHDQEEGRHEVSLHGSVCKACSGCLAEQCWRSEASVMQDSPELPPLPDEAPPPLPEGAPPPLPSDGPADMDMESSRSPGFFQQSHPYQQPVYSYGQ